MRVTYCTAALTVNDTVYSWTKSKVKTAQIIEEVDPSCQELSINEATVCVIDEDKEFDITNTAGAWNDLEYDQPLVLTEYVDGTAVACGTYYLDGWKYADNLATFTAVDAIGYIARRSYVGHFYNNATAMEVLYDIMTAGEYDDYTIDTDLASTTLTGFLPSSDCREALRCLCLALGAVADCRRSSTISITTAQQHCSEYIGTDRKFYGNTSAELDEAVATLTFSVPIYTAGTETETLFCETLPAGTHTITLDPFVEDSIDIAEMGDNVSAYGVGGCEITVKSTSAGTVTITGIKYTATNTTFSATTTVENFSDFPETKTYSCPLYNLSTMQTVMASHLEYWQLRKSMRVKYLLNEEIAGDWVNVVDEDSQASTVRLSRQTIDLAGGFVSVAEAKGYTGDMYDVLFSDDEDTDDGDDETYDVTGTGYYSGNEELYAADLEIGNAII